jgi:arsenate reductase-like glutaredoxin family protein
MAVSARGHYKKEQVNKEELVDKSDELSNGLESIMNTHREQEAYKAMKFTDYFDQYNRLSDVLTFTNKKLTRKDIYSASREDNLRLKQIYDRLRSPTGHF